MKIKYQTLIITIASGTAAAPTNHPVDLDLDYDRAIGVAAYPVNNGGDPKYLIGLRQDIGPVFQDRTINTDWISDTNIKHADRYKSFADAIPAKGKRMIVEIENTITLTADLEVHMVFMLVKD